MVSCGRELVDLTMSGELLGTMSRAWLACRAAGIVWALRRTLRSAGADYRRCRAGGGCPWHDPAAIALSAVPTGGRVGEPGARLMHRGVRGRGIGSPPMIPLDEAVATVLSGCQPLPPRPVPAGEAVGCVLAEDVVAAEALPPFANSAMDGYAVRAADVATVPVELPVVAEVAAGHPAPRPLAAGETMRIFTGAPLPEGADAVVMVEHTDRLDGGHRVAIHRVATPAAHVRPAGDDVRVGDRVLAAGEPLTAGGLGLLRSLGVARVAVHPRPRVGVLSTGDELVDEPAEGSGPLRPGQIRDSNRPALLALVGPAGGTPVDLGHATDDEVAISAALTRAVEECDLVLSTGGVSMGDTDLVKVVLERLAGAGMRWMQVAIKPAKPLAFGVAGGRGVPVLGLPGNPVSSMVSFELFARPALRRLAGHPDHRVSRASLPAVAVEALPRRVDGKLHLVRVVAEAGGGELRVRRAGLGQGSHQLSAMARANALALLPDGSGVEAGQTVRVLLLDELHAPAIF